jgi:hypothetical protein
MKISPTWEDKEQPDDNKVAGSPWFYISTYKEYQEGLKVALHELSKHSYLLQELELKSSPYEQEINTLTTMIDWGKEKIENITSDYDLVILAGVTYGSLRYLKAGILLRAKYLMDKRKEMIISNKSIPRSVLRSFDERDQQLLNLAEQGVLNGLRPAEIFFEVVPNIGEAPDMVDTPEPSLRSSITGDEYIKTDLPIVDPILRERCLSMLRNIKEGGKEEQLDAVIREMSVILEDRIRELSGQPEKMSGAELITFAMKKEPVRIVFSEIADIQESAYLLFRGYSGFVRNEVMHKLVTSYTYDRVLQLLGIVDYLLFILSKAEIRKKDG